ncbi:MAG: MBL fold metallo-hydrolase [Thermodesulfobacteriota bacterium]
MDKYYSISDKTKYKIGNDNLLFLRTTHNVETYGVVLELTESRLKILYSSDTNINGQIWDYVDSNNLLIHEAAASPIYEDENEEIGHSFAIDVAKKPQSKKLKNLCLVHLPHNLIESKTMLYSKLKNYFKGNLFLPDDLDSISFHNSKLSLRSYNSKLSNKHSTKRNSIKKCQIKMKF